MLVGGQREQKNLESFLEVPVLKAGVSNIVTVPLVAWHSCG